jgi:cell wall-associated NlpC family hydrolase
VESDTQVSTVNEQDVPVSVGSLVTGTALGMGTVEAEGVNVRENPNMDADVVTVLEQGAQVVVLSKDGDWYRVSCEGVTGFVSCDYMSLEDAGQAELGYGLVKCAAANIRAAADTESDPVGSLEEGEVVTITGISDGWYTVDLGDTVGYIRSDLVDPTAEIPAEKIYDYAVIECSAANLRSEPDSSSEKTDVLYDGSLCTLLEQDGEWYKVQYGDTVGYVLASLMTTTNDENDGSTDIESYNETVAREKAEAEAAAAEAAKKAAASSSTTSTSGSSSSSSGSSSSATGSSGSTSGSSSSQTTYTEPTYSEPTTSTSSYDSVSSGSIVSVAENYMGVPYVWGGTSPSGFDCSGFTQYVFRQCGYSINRTAAAQYSNGSYVSYSDLQAGDLVFFANTYSASGITHVGIYIGGGQFIHCANGGVKISSLSESYYSSRYYGARRIA